MKSIIKHQFLGSLFIIGALSFFSCKKDNPPTPTPTSTKGTLSIHLHNYLDTAEVETYGEVYPTKTGRKISMSKGQLYLSHIQLIKADGSTLDISDKILLKVQDEEVYTLGSVPAGNYKSIRFMLGLDSATNKKTPSSSTDDVLNKSEMWFGATAQPQGYVYLNFQGKVDTSALANNTEAQMQAFSFKIGTNANSRTITMPDKNYTVVPGQTEYIHLLADYTQLFTGIQLNKANLKIETPADNGLPQAKTMSGNISTLFKYEE